MWEFIAIGEIRPQIRGPLIGFREKHFAWELFV